MPPLKVEYAASGRSKCALSGCGKVIAKHEVRVGTGAIMPFGEDNDTLSYKWRHLCCFTDRQIKNSESSGDLDNIEGYDELAPADKQLIDEMKKGKLIGKTNIIGRIGDIKNSPVFSAAAGKRKRAASPQEKSEGKAKKGGAAAASSGGAKTGKRGKTSDFVDTDEVAPTAAATGSTEETANVVDDMWDAETVEYDVELEDQKPEKPTCPHGRACYRTNPQHFRDYSHGELEAASESKGENSEEEAKSVQLVKVPIAKVRGGGGGAATSAAGAPATGNSVPPRNSGGGANDSRPACPNGTLCFRKDPLHFKAYRH